MNETPRYASVRDYLRVVRERRLLIVALTLLVTGGAYLYTSQQDTVYDADATLEFQSLNTQTSLFGQQVDVGGQTPESRAAAAASTLVKPAVLERAKAALDYPGPALALGGSVVARPEARTNLVIVTGRGPSGGDAANIANAVARAAVEVTRDEVRQEYAQAAEAQRRVLKELSKQKNSGFSQIVTRQSIARLDELSRVATPAVLRREATAPRSPSSPHDVRTTLLGLLAGLTLGLVAAFFRDSLDGRFRAATEISDDLDLRVLGHVREEVLGSGLVPGKRRFWRRRKGSLSETDLEAFRILRTNLEFLDYEGDPKLVMVASAMPGEGKSTVATSLAATYALAGLRTLIVETDLRRPVLASRLGVSPSPGLTDYLVGEAEPAEVLQTIALPPQPKGTRAADAPEPGPITAIVAGTRVPQPAELLSSGRCRRFFEEVKESYDVVILDTPPLLSVVDALELLPLADAVVLCVRGSQTTRGQLETAKDMLTNLPHGPVGVVVTGLRVGDQESHYGYYAYGPSAGAAAR